MLKIDKQDVLTSNMLSMHMTNDGKHLFTGDLAIRRFRVEGNDLIYEQSSARLANGHTTHFALSSDGKWTAMPTGGGQGSGYNIFVFDPSDLLRPRFSLVNGAYPCAIGFDPKTGHIYSANRNLLNVFDAQGHCLTEFNLGMQDVHRITVHPQGERFVVWSSTKIVYCDLDLERMPTNPFEVIHSDDASRE
jgi:hypothetical protein